MAEDGNGFDCENGSSKNQTSTSEGRRRASKEANHAWASLKRRKAPRGNPEAAASKRWSVSEASSSKSRRTSATIAESAAKELESLAVHMPNVSDSDARALRFDHRFEAAASGLPLGAFLPLYLLAAFLRWLMFGS